MMELIFEPILKDIKKEQEKIATLPWIEKYRPTELNSILSHDRIIKMLQTYIKKRSLPHLLFYGPSGTGKTSTIMACARELYGKQYSHMVLELNASDDRGIDVVRNRIRKFVMGDNVFFGKNLEDQQNIFKLVILDETDAMTYDAQAILRKVVEKYSYNARFCLICNSNKKIIPPLQSRCATYRFSPLEKNVIIGRIFEVAKLENINVTERGAELIARKSEGDMRRVLNVLQTVSMAYDEVTENNISHCLCYPKRVDIMIILKSLLDESFEYCVSNLQNYQKNNGVSLGDIINEFEHVIRDSILEPKTVPLISNVSIKSKAFFLDQLRVIEYNLLASTNESIQLYGLISIFKKLEN